MNSIYNKKSLECYGTVKTISDKLEQLLHVI